LDKKNKDKITRVIILKNARTNTSLVITLLITFLLIAGFTAHFLFSYLSADNSADTGASFISNIAESTVKSRPCLKISDIKVAEAHKGRILPETESEVNVGDSLIFTITVQNNGNMNAREFEIVNFLPEKLKVIQADIKENGKYYTSDKKIIWHVGELKAGGKIRVSFKAEVGREFVHLEKFISVFRVIYNGEALAEKTFEKRVNALAVLNRSEIEVKDINGGDIWALDKLRYTILIKNTGEEDGKDIEVYCPIPAGMGYIDGSATEQGFSSNQNKSLLKWNINTLSKGEVKKLTFEVFIVDYVTYGGKIKTGFYILDGEKRIELDNPVIDVNPDVFEKIVCMGDSLTYMTGYPEILEGLLEKEFPHAEFNVITSGINGEMANQAIRRFDRDIRIHNPDIIILGYGANDAGEEIEYYRYFMDVLIKQATSTGAKVFVFGVGYIDLTVSKWIGKANYTDFNKMLEKEICPKNGAVYIDLFSEMSKNPRKYLKPDGMHWNEEGTDLAVNIIIRTLVDYMDGDGRIISSSL